MNLLHATLARIAPQDVDWRAKAKARLDQLIMPHWALGRLMDLAVDLAGISRSMAPAVARKTIVTMAGDHGVVAEGVSAYPQAVTGQMVANFLAGGAAINVLARQIGARVVVADLGVASDLPMRPDLYAAKVARGTANMVHGPAMRRSYDAGNESRLARRHG